MSERCIVRIRFTPAGAEGTVRRAVGGFLRYVQHRDLHPDSEPKPAKPSVSGLVKYVAYRDSAQARAELFGSRGARGTTARKEFVEFVARSLAGSQPHLFRTRDGALMDRRRAVSRLILSPERSQGLDLERLTRAAVERLGAEAGAEGLQWIAAIHRNTAHHHVHLVIAGMREDASGRYHRFDVTKPRLAAMKQAVVLEIERQRAERLLSKTQQTRVVGVVKAGTESTLALRSPIGRSAVVRIPPVAAAGHRMSLRPAETSYRPTSLIRLRAVARRYQHRVEREAEEEARLRRWELVA